MKVGSGEVKIKAIACKFCSCLNLSDYVQKVATKSRTAEHVSPWFTLCMYIQLHAQS